MGRMAAHVAYRLQGKNIPGVSKSVLDHNQYCVVVNSDHPLVMGNRMKTRIFYRHTGHPGGFRQTRMKDFVRKDSIKMVSTVWSKT